MPLAAKDVLRESLKKFIYSYSTNMPNSLRTLYRLNEIAKEVIRTRASWRIELSSIQIFDVPWGWLCDKYVNDEDKDKVEKWLIDYIEDPD